MIDKEHDLPVTKQCEILELSRSTVYYKPVPVSERDLMLMRFIDEIHLKRPYYGSRRMAGELGALGHDIGRKHTATLMRRMGIEALYRKPRLSIPDKEHEIYPYLLKGLVIDRPNQVWATDITYIPMKRGFGYLVAVIDWYSRKVLLWRLSNSLHPSFCVEALEEALEKYGSPDIFNTDQGSQFTSNTFINVLLANNVKPSMDGKGRWVDNVFVERPWRSVKYEEVYLRAYETMTDARKHLKSYFEFYNSERRHQSLDNQTPDIVYSAKKKAA